jgi:hypothetical protein
MLLTTSFPVAVIGFSVYEMGLKYCIATSCSL